MYKENHGTMEYVYAALLLHKLHKEVNESNISSVVKASGAEVNNAQVKALVAALADVDIEEAIKAVPVAVAAAAPTAAAGEPKKEEKTVDTSKSEEAAMEGLSSLFG
jgi:large subunit ribosomal protein L12